MDDFMKEIKEKQEQLKAALNEDAKLRGQFIKGRLFSVSVADGKAFYRVTKVNKTTVDVEWQDLYVDDYVDTVLGYGGRFPRSNIEGIVKREDSWAQIFGGENANR